MTEIFKKVGLDTAGLRTHSFRIGGATEAHKAGISDVEATKHGAWSDLLTYCTTTVTLNQRWTTSSRSPNPWESNNYTS